MYHHSNISVAELLSFKIPTTILYLSQESVLGYWVSVGMLLVFQTSLREWILCKRI